MTITIEFCGGGWLTFFHMGIADYLQQTFNTENKYFRFSGNSGGSLIAACLSLNIDINKIYEEFLKSYSIPTEACRNVYKSVLNCNVPDESWQKLKNKLYVGVSEICIENKIYFKPITISEFSSNEYAAEILSASCNFPIVGEFFPQNKLYDGMLSGEYPIVPETTRNVKVNLDNNSKDISPGIKLPSIWILYPPPMHILKELVYLGKLRTAEYFSIKENRLPKRLYKNNVNNVNTHSIMYNDDHIEITNDTNNDTIQYELTKTLSKINDYIILNKIS